MMGINRPRAGQAGRNGTHPGSDTPVGFEFPTKHQALVTEK